MDNDRLGTSKELITTESKVVKNRESNSSGKNVLQMPSGNTGERKKISELEKEEMANSVERMRDMIKNL